MIRLFSAGSLALLASVSAQAAIVHVDAVPSTVDPSFSKATSDYMYLEGETVTQGASDTYATAGDASHTFYRTSANPSDFWGSGAVYDGARYAARGADGSFTNINAYWEDLTTGLASGVYDVHVRAYAAPGGTQTFSLYAGEDRASVDSGTSLGSVTTLTDGVARFYKIGSIAISEDTDTFRLKVDTTSSTVRFDTVLFTAVPEPGSIGMILVGGLMLVTRCGKR